MQLSRSRLTNTRAEHRPAAGRRRRLPARWRPALALSFLVLLFAGCAYLPQYTLGKSFNPSRTADLIKGQSTRDDVLRLFGAPPESSEADLAKAAWWRYYYVYLGPLAIERANLEVDFKGDVVSDYQLQVTQSRD